MDTRVFMLVMATSVIKELKHNAFGGWSRDIQDYIQDCDTSTWKNY